MKRTKSSKKLKILNAICSLVLIVALFYLVSGGIELAAFGVMTAAIIGVAIPVVIAGGGVLEIIFGIFEALLEGVVAIVEGILGLISGIFS
ncbi:MAG: hypothetical protein OQK04_07425 [Kangiellaceae bacterium]|nr:hypothetical protein [Kangiellaceae bacterium]MCW8998530.1 hypothetical protein [Kangiellaceae bacterium]